MDRETVDKIIENLYQDLNQGDDITLAFQGGEPTLAGLEWFKYFVAAVNTHQKGVKIHYALQTNGILINDDWAAFFAANVFLIGLSIDGVKKIHDTNRKDTGGNETWEKCLAAKGTLEKHGVEYNILSVLTNTLATHPDKVWNFIIREKMKTFERKLSGEEECASEKGVKT
jgi:uncharacterized protein